MPAPVVGQLRHCQPAVGDFDLLDGTILPGFDKCRYRAGLPRGIDKAVTIEIIAAQRNEQLTFAGLATVDGDAAKLRGRQATAARAENHGQLR